MFKRFIEFFEDECGTLSISRLLIALVVGFFLMWESFIVYQTKTITDIPAGYIGLVTILYTINKVKPTLENIVPYISTKNNK